MSRAPAGFGASTKNEPTSSALGCSPEGKLTKAIQRHCSSARGMFAIWGLPATSPLSPVVVKPPQVFF